MEVKDLILRHEDFLENYGFQLEQNVLHFAKTIPHGNQIIFFHHTHQNEASYLEYQLGIRNHKVEFIINRFLPSLGDYKDRSLTLIETIDQINPEFPKRFLIENEDEISSTLALAQGFLVKEGFDWLNKHSDPYLLESIFNSQPEQEIITQNFTYRSARGVTMSKLYNPKEYDNVKKFYLTRLEEMQETPFTLASFLNLLNYLENL